MIKISKESLFNGLDFSKIIDNEDFKEDSVREVIILPLLKALGYNQENIVRSKTLQNPFVRIGTSKRKVNLIPDYLLKIENNYAWVLDAKSPKQDVTDPDNIEQVYSYAINPEIRSTYFSVCNGIKFALYRQDTIKPILLFNLEEIEHYWEQLQLFLAPQSFQLGKNITYDNNSITAKQATFSYIERPLLEEIPVRKQAAKRHFGVHGYFTKQTWNVVAEYIKNYTKPNDLILDPFGGSGVTAIEALMNDRKAIHIDLNPMSIFMVNSIVSPVNIAEFTDAFNKLKETYINKEPNSEEEINIALESYQYPKGFILPKDSDVRTIEELFTKKQLAQLAYLKHLIKKVKNVQIRNSFLLAFSSSLNKFNLTFHYTKSEGGGDSSPFRYYRYRIAPEPGILNLMDIFETKFRKVLQAKIEILPKINNDTINNITIKKGTATKLKFIPKESIDYIYTDPPYGKKIPYLDLSVMWNSWLDLEVTEDDYQDEAIEGGEHKKSKKEYNLLMSESIQEMYRVLKFDRWLSFVFAHKDPEFWHLIVETAEKCGFEYVAAVAQKNGQTSFKKRQNPFTVLSGQLIINFRKVKNPKAIMRAHLGMDISEVVMQTIEGIIAKNNGATLEQINDELIIKGLELGFLDLLKKEYSDLTPILIDKFNYNEETEIFSIKKDAKFSTHIDVRLRIKYYLQSYLRRMERENRNPTFDEIVMNIIPLLKNGTTPENQTILKVLEDIGEHIGDNKWKLRKLGQIKLFE